MGVPMSLKPSDVIHRHPVPVLTRDQVPYPATLVFNAGVCKVHGKYAMVFRNDYGRWGDTHFDGTNLGLAWSDDGLKWTVEPKPVWDQTDPALREAAGGDVLRVYDPRLTVIGEVIHICFACDTGHGVRGGVAVTPDFRSFEVKSLSTPDNRNMALFPEKIGGKFVRLERPMPVYSRGQDRFDIWISDSADLVYWGHSRLVAAVEHFPYANNKIGPAAPPIKTPKGWLATTHAVDLDKTRGKRGWEPVWQKRYTAGLMLLDLEDPTKVIGLCRRPLLSPEAPYERQGFRDDTIFPGGMILEDNGQVKIYYGAGDAVEALATAHVDDLLALCEPV
jgi:beta-1,4-mannooligosaccharide/beta-1,4-mannosyl-N-acetylglucosamine phosphorylase